MLLSNENGLNYVLTTLLLTDNSRTELGSLEQELEQQPSEQSPESETVQVCLFFLSFPRLHTLETATTMATNKTDRKLS